MSVRAHKITKMEWNSRPTFNLWHCHNALLDMVCCDGGDGFDCNGGIIEVSKDLTIEAIEKVKQLEWDDETKSELLDDLKAILADFGEDEFYVSYQCF